MRIGRKKENGEFLLQMELRKKKMGLREILLVLGWSLIIICYFGCLQSYGRMEISEAVTLVFSDRCPTGREIRNILNSQEEMKSEELLCFYWDGGVISAEEPGYSRRRKVHLAGLYGDASLFDKRIRGFADDDREGCVIDGKTAEELFGNKNVLGRELMIGGKTYVVRKVVNWRQRLVLIHNQSEEAPYGRVFYQCGKGNKAAMSEQFLMRYGLNGEQAAAGVVYGAAKAAVWILPFFIFLDLLAYGMKQKRRAWKKSEKALWTGVCVLVSVVMARGILENIHLSADWLPGKWSDFDFWFRRMEEEQEKLEFYFMVSRTAVEIEMLCEAFRTIAFGVLGAFFFLMVTRKCREKDT